MRHLYTAVALAILASLVACASNSARDHYYSLVLASENERSASSENTGDTRMIVGPIQLARYLDQPGLPIQTSESQIQSANHHLWAEALDEAIAKVLVQDIARRTDGVAVERDSGRWTPRAHCRLRVEFDKFHSTSDSNVVVTGRYWIHRTNSEAVTKHEFDIVRPLSSDGYAHAVRQLRAALDSLAAEIAQRSEAVSACALVTEAPAG